MNAEAFLALYDRHPQWPLLEKLIRERSRIQLHRLSGSLDAVVASHMLLRGDGAHVFVFSDADRALAFFDDLRRLSSGKEVLFFPAHKETVTALPSEAVLARNEVRNALGSSFAHGIVTYPEALVQQLESKETLHARRFTLSAGDVLDMRSLVQAFHARGFYKVDTVQIPGEYAIRGGIVDVFSYAHVHAHRVELWDDSIASIRRMDVGTQLSLKEETAMYVLAKGEDNDSQVYEGVSLLECMPESACVWIEDVQLLLDRGEQETASGRHGIGKAALVEQLSSHACIELGPRFYFSDGLRVEWESEVQPSFHKDYGRIAEHLSKQQHAGLRLVIDTSSAAQEERFRKIFSEVDADVRFEALGMGLRGGFVDHTIGLLLYTDHELIGRPQGHHVPVVSYKASTVLSREALNKLHPGDYVVHADHGIGRFGGLEVLRKRDKEQEWVRLIYRNNDLLYVPIHALHKVSRYRGNQEESVSLTKLGRGEWSSKKRRAKRRIKDMSKELLRAHALRKASRGFAFERDDVLQAELEASFIYEDTPDQSLAVEAVKGDMEAESPMDRLICGDVGFGKTEVAIRAAFKAVCGGKQVSVLAPTTVLVMQHYHTFSDRLSGTGVRVACLHRFVEARRTREVSEGLRKGEIDILIGTSRMMNAQIAFKDLGLLVIDEEQKFGVRMKEKLRAQRPGVDTLTLSATPIPRTLHFALMQAVDMSSITTPPPNRQAIHTSLHVFDERLIQEVVRTELDRKGQVFFVHNRVQGIEDMVFLLSRLIPDARIGMTHGQMKGVELEKNMRAFVAHRYDILVSTNIVENGLDIPNANTMLIHEAHMFGLSDLHQLRGRIGRSGRKAYCYLLCPPTSKLSMRGQKRLEALEAFSGLGDGLKIAMKDLEMRGTGNVLGSEQSGYIDELGFDMYEKLLGEALRELRTEEAGLMEGSEVVEESMSRDCVMETDEALLIPHVYVSSDTERLALYKEVNMLRGVEERMGFEAKLRDRFGPLPAAVRELLQLVQLRWVAVACGFVRVVLKGGCLRCYFPSDEAYYVSDVFKRVLTFAELYPDICRIEAEGSIRIRPVKSIDKALFYVEGMQKKKEKVGK